MAKEMPIYGRVCEHAWLHMDSQVTPKGEDVHTFYCQKCLAIHKLRMDNSNKDVKR